MSDGEIITGLRHPRQGMSSLREIPDSPLDGISKSDALLGSCAGLSERTNESHFLYRHSQVSRHHISTIETMFGCSDATVFVDLLLFTPTPRARGALVHCASLWLFSLRHLPCDTFPPPSPTAKHPSRIREFRSPHRPVSVHRHISHLHMSDTEVDEYLRLPEGYESRCKHCSRKSCDHLCANCRESLPSFGRQHLLQNLKRLVSSSLRPSIDRGPPQPQRQMPPKS